MDSDRVKQQGTYQLFETITKFAENIPVVIVCTKKDKFVHNRLGAAVLEGRDIAEAKQNAENEVRERLEVVSREILDMLGRNHDAVVAVSIRKFSP